MDEKTDNQYNPADWLYIILIIGFAALILTFISFSHPITITTADNYEYIQKGTFDYYSSVPNNLYETNQLATGDPIFRQVNDSINLDFVYELDSDKHVKINNGTFELLAIIKDTTGWERSIPLVVPSLIQESSFISSAVLNLNDVESVIDYFEEQTGINNKRYTLIIQPQVTIEGTIGGRSFEDTFDPELTFNMDEQKLVLADSSAEESNSLQPTSSGFVLGTKKAPNTISILWFKLNVLLARIISVIILAGIIVVLFNFSNHFVDGPSDPGNIQQNRKK